MIARTGKEYGRYAEKMIVPVLLREIAPRATSIVILPLGAIGKREIVAVRGALARAYALRVSVAPRRPLPKATFYPPRRRYRAEHLVAWLAKGGPGDKVLGLTSADVSTTAHGRKDWGVAGLGTVGGRAAIVSSFRTHGNLSMLTEVAVHEIGHTLGLPHCPHRSCVMRDAKGKLDRIGRRFCPDCRHRIGPFLKRH